MKKDSFLSRLFGFLYVPRCVGCKELLPDSSQILCEACMRRYKLLCHRKCRNCGNDLCVCDCAKEGMEANGTWRLSKLCAYLPKEKNSPFKGMMYALKHKNNSDVREFFAEELASMIRRKCDGYESYTICYVPRSRKMKKKYGYDHMQEIARLVSNKLGVGYVDAFYKNEGAKEQKKLKFAARFKNAQNSIMLKDGTDVADRRYILLDDVSVTGASLGRCASLLINEDAREVRSFVIAVRP